MMQIRNPLVKRLLLEQVIEDIEAGGIDRLLQAGFSAQFLDAMRHRSVRDLLQVAELPITIHARFDESSVTSSLTRIDHSRRSAQLREYFVRHGASVRMMRDLFHLGADDVRALRAQLLDASEPLRGRMPAACVRDRIHKKWYEVRREHPHASFRDQIYQLHQAFRDVPIDALCRTLNEFDEKPEPTNAARRTTH